MKFWEAMKALEEGKKCRACIWSEGEHVVSVSDIVYELCDTEEYRLLDLVTCDWELYEEPVKTYTFQEIIPFLRDGKRVRRLSGSSILVKGDNSGFCLTFKDVESNDWIVLE